MIITADSLTLSFLVVASVTLAVVVVLIWYVYTTKKFREDIIKLMDEKLEMYLENLETPKQEEEEPAAEVAEQEPEEQEPQKDETEFAEKREEPQEDETEFAEKREEPQKDFVEESQSFVENTK